MERLESKKIHGHTYYYYSKWAWVDGKCRRVWQKYLGKLENIVRAVDQGGPAPLCAEVFQWGLPMALWKESLAAELLKHTDQLCPKRKQGLSTAEYLVIAAINRAIRPTSKRSMWEWFSQTSLLRQVPHASKISLVSQRFWDHMDKINAQMAASIWKRVIKGVVEREDIDLSSVSYDGTNFYTFIDTFNTRCQIAKRGRNKQGRNNLRQVSYALFCCADGHVPLFYDVYEGNRNDAKQFPLMLGRFHDFFKELSGENGPVPDTTVIFDKGNNSVENFILLDSMELDFVGSVKVGEHKELARTPNNDRAFVPCRATGLEGTKALRVTKKVYGRQRTLVVTYNQNLFNAQWMTLQNDIEKAGEKLSLLQGKLRERACGIIKRGKAPTAKSISNQCRKILGRQHLKNIIKITVNKGPNDIPQLDYAIDTAALHELSQTWLGKNILITSRDDWDDAKIIKAYRSQFIIEDVFKEMKDRNTGNWWPLNYWTDSKIRVHGLYCTLALLLRALMFRRLRKAGLELSLKRMLSELNSISEVVTIYPRKRRQKSGRKQTTLTRTSELQQKLLSILGLNKEDPAVLG
jgi:transposase